MDARDYITKVARICHYYDSTKGCKGCPLHGMGCGTPKSEEIEKTLEIVERFEIPEEITLDSVLANICDSYCKYPRDEVEVETECENCRIGIEITELLKKAL